MSSPFPLSKTDHTLRNGLVLFFLWILIEGMLRKWVVPALATPIFFFKYVIIGYLLAYFVLHRVKVLKNHFPYIGILFFYIIYCFLELFNMDVTDKLSVGAVGIAVHLGFIPLAFFIPQVITRPQQYSKLIRTVAWISLPIFVLGIIQYFSPQGSFINRYVADDMKIAMVGSHVRIATVFSYLAGHGVYLIFVMPFLFIYITTKFDPDKSKLLVIVTFMLGLLNLLMTGSRGPVFFFAVDVVLLFLGIALGWGGADAKLKSLFPSLLGFCLLELFCYCIRNPGMKPSKHLPKRTKDSQYDAYIAG